MHITLFEQDIVHASPEVNRQAAEQEMERHAGCDIFVMPETFTTGFGPHITAHAEAPDGPTFQWASTMAQKHQCLVVGTWVVSDGEHLRNRMHWMYPDGRSGHYDKAHTFRMGGEAEWVERGCEKVVFEWRGWRIRPAVCYDLRFPVWLRNAPLQYDMLLICANWPTKRRGAWDVLLQARAVENQCYVVACNRTGTDPSGVEYNGGSVILNYKGQPCSDADLDLDALRTFRQRWPFHLDAD